VILAPQRKQAIWAGGKQHNEKLRDLLSSSNNVRNEQSQDKFGFGHAAHISGRRNAYKISSKY
jgi:hypothetical protein